MDLDPDQSHDAEIRDPARSVASPFHRISPSDLNARQIETYHLQKLSGLLADFGFTTFPLRDDWNGADLLAMGLDGETLRIQLKSRETFGSKYEGKNIWVAYPFERCTTWCICPHDQCLNSALALGKLKGTLSWDGRGGYNWGRPPGWLLEILTPYNVSPSP